MKKRNRRERKQLLVRVLAITLAVLLIGGSVVSAIVSALAEETPASPRDSYTLEIVYLEDEQALHITQRLVYHNRTGVSLDHVMFNVPANMFRRQDALCYETDALSAVFPDGYAPAGIDFVSVRVNGTVACWGMSGTNETAMRIAVELPVGGSAEFEFEYWLLLGNNRSFLGMSSNEVRLAGFYPIPGVYIDSEETFVTSEPLQHTRWLFSDKADYSVTLTVPKDYEVSGTGTVPVRSVSEDRAVYTFEASKVPELSLILYRKVRVKDMVCSDTSVRIITRKTDAGAEKAVTELLTLYEEWFGAFPYPALTVAVSDYPLGALTYPGLILLPSSVLSDRNALTLTLGSEIAKQYIGLSSYPEPVTDAWMTDATCSYVSLLATETLSGTDAFLRALNERVLDSLNITIPGGLYVTSDAKLFTQDEYDLIVLGRGTAVMHEVRLALGRENFLAGLRCFFEKGADQDILGEYDLVDAIDEATGGSCESLLTYWLFNIGDYVGQEIDWYE